MVNRVCYLLEKALRQKGEDGEFSRRHGVTLQEKKTKGVVIRWEKG